MGSTFKTTPLHAWHTAQGANMAGFGGYDMPLWYGSVRQEHLAVLTAAGLFDTSHMAELRVEGPDAVALLQDCFTNDLAHCVGPGKNPLSDGRCVYGAFLHPDGSVIDDAIVFRISEAGYFVVVNAGMGNVVADHLSTHRKGGSVRITDLSDRLGKMDIQGPQAARILSTVLADPKRVFDRMPYFSFKGHFDPSQPGADAVRLRDGTPILLSRTGYTGEFGFEVFIAPEKTFALWEALLAAGTDRGLIACGLAARDSLRAGAVLPLSHQDIGHWPFIHHPWPFALPWTADGTGFTKPFVGDAALLGAADADHTLAFIGNDLRKVVPPAEVLTTDGRVIGTVLTCATDMGIGRVNGTVYSLGSPDKPEGFAPKGLCCGFVKITRPLAAGETVHLKDSHREITVTIVSDIRPARTARVPLATMLD